MRPREVQGSEAGSTSERGRVVMLHCSASSAQQWRGLAARLEDAFHPISVDLCGHGDRDAWHGDGPLTLAQDVEAIENAVGDHHAPYHPIGHSYGGGVALRSGLDHDPRLRSLTLIEWFTQQHYLEHVRDDTDLDELFRDILKFHWIDESQHAKADSLLIDELARDLSEGERQAAVDEVLELGMAIDGLLAQQIELDIETLGRVTKRTFSAGEKDEIRSHQQRAYRWTFLVSGLEHPNFVRIVNELTKSGGEKIAGAATALAA